jgi:carbon monoxide dehydrogenase subunit G
MCACKGEAVPGPVISYQREDSFRVPPYQIWAAIEDVEEFESWWAWLEDFRLEGDGLVVGAVLSGVVVPPLPYRMRLSVELVACDRPTAIDAVVRGDLRGDARLRLRPQGDGTLVEVAWTIEMMQRPMRLASRFAHPLLRWGHDRVVEATVDNFRRHVEGTT